MIPIEKAAAILTALKSLDEAMADADTEYAEDNFVHNIGQRLVCEDMRFIINLINDIEEAEK
jgi:hypothetical protein